MNKVLFSRYSDEWSTPQDFFDSLNDIYHFTLDPCSTLTNHKCSKFFTKDDDGLLKSWDNEVVFCNPPYSDIRSWLEKAISSKCRAIFLVPARTDTRWFHDLIYNIYPITFIKGRLKFGDTKTNAPFPSMLIDINNF